MTGRGRRGLRPGWRDLGLLVPFAAAGLWAARGHTGAALVAAGAAVVLVVARLVRGDRLHHDVAVVARLAERALTAALVGALWALSALPAAALSALTRHDPLAPSTPGWQLAERHDTPRRPHGGARAPGPRRWHGAALVVALAALALAPGPSGPEPTAEIALAGGTWWAPPFADQPDGRALWLEHAQVGTVGDARLAWRSPELDLPHTHVSGQARRTWRPPGTGPARTVWVFGGSTAFGLGQRDEHTIASELARAAAEDGQRLLVQNYGVIAYVAWQEVALFERLLGDQPPPDLVVFYHRSNDAAVACRRVEQGIDPDEPMVLPELSPTHPLPAAPPTGDGVPCQLAVDRTARALADQIDDAMAEARRLAAAAGIRVLEVWQPDGWTIAAGAATARYFRERQQVDPEARAPRTEAIDRALDLVAVRPVDLGAALDDAPGETLFDIVHHNELGAEMIGRAMWPHVAEALDPPGGPR